jgi:hypothetical protein
VHEAVKPRELDAENVAIEEEERSESLVLGRRCDAQARGERVDPGAS